MSSVAVSRIAILLTVLLSGSYQLTLHRMNEHDFSVEARKYTVASCGDFEVKKDGVRIPMGWAYNADKHIERAIKEDTANCTTLEIKGYAHGPGIWQIWIHPDNQDKYIRYYIGNLQFDGRGEFHYVTKTGHLLKYLQNDVYRNLRISIQMSGESYPNGFDVTAVNLIVVHPVKYIPKQWNKQ